MARPGFLPPWFWRVALAAVVAAAVAVSARWAVRVPIFEAPDEDLHFDYVISILSAGRPLHAAGKPVAEMSEVSPYPPVTHPWTWHLELYVRSKEIRFHPEIKVPAGYGTAEFYAAVDRSAPRRFLPPLRNPWLITEYPSGYYALAALWLAVWRNAFPGAVLLFFATRAFSILLLAIGLLAIHGTLRESGASRARALGLTAAVGLFPLTSFVSSYVQPDNLAFAATALSLWAALRARRRPLAAGGTGRLLAAGAALGLLLLAKYHVFLSVAVPVLAFLAVEQARQPRARRQWGRWAFLLLAPVLLLGAYQYWVSSSGGGPALRNLTYATGRWKLIAEAGGRAPYLARVTGDAFANFLGADGVTYKTFWGLSGWLDTPLVIRSPQVDEVVDFSVHAGSLALLALLAVRLQQTATALVRIWRRGKRRQAIRLLVANPLLNSYLAFAALMLALYVWTNNGFLAQGRNWFPQLPGMFWAVACCAPRALASRKLGRLAGRAVLTGLLLYAVIGGYWSLRAIETRYYGAPPAVTGMVVSGESP